LPPAIWAGVRVISWVGSCFAAQHRSWWRDDAQEYRVSDVQVWRRSLEAWLRRAVRAAGRPSLAVVNKSEDIAPGGASRAVSVQPADAKTRGRRPEKTNATVAAMEAAIRDGRYTPQSLFAAKEDALAREFGVSRTTIRHALKILKEKEH